MSQKRSTKKNLKSGSSTQNPRILFRYLKLSPGINRVTETLKPKITLDEFSLSHVFVASPKPSRLNPSPLIAQKKLISLSKLTPLRNNSTTKASSRVAINPKFLTMTQATPTNISCPNLPLAQDFYLFMVQLLDSFFCPESLTEYFFLSRENTLSFGDFLESSVALGVDSYFPDLTKIFEEAANEKYLDKDRFLARAIQVQNSEMASGVFDKKDGNHIKLSGLMRKMQINSTAFSVGNKKIQAVAKNGKKHPEVCEVALNTKEIMIMPDYSKLDKSNRRKLNLYTSVKLNSSPYKKIHSSLVCTNKLQDLSKISQSKTPPRYRGKS